MLKVGRKEDFHCCCYCKKLRFDEVGKKTEKLHNKNDFYDSYEKMRFQQGGHAAQETSYTIHNLGLGC